MFQDSSLLLATTNICKYIRQDQCSPARLHLVVRYSRWWRERHQIIVDAYELWACYDAGLH